ncbi:rhodanese-like domain-containing protein [Acidisoma sp. C75]
MVDDIEPRKVWEAMSSEPRAQLCDVRTEAEWTFVGVPDLRPLAREPILIPWQSYPSMQRNAQFVDHLRSAGLAPDQPIYFICRSGARSMAAAEAAAMAGFTRVYNVAEGFEGPLDPEGHRGRVGGWKAAGLPWRQG